MKTQTLFVVGAVLAAGVLEVACNDALDTENRNEQLAQLIGSIQHNAEGVAGAGQKSSLFDEIDLGKLQEAFENTDPYTLEVLWAVLGDSQDMQADIGRPLNANEHGGEPEKAAVEL